VTSCSACDAGYIAPNSGSSSCSACPAGQFQPLTGGIACLPCAAGFTSTSGAAVCTAITCTPPLVVNLATNTCSCPAPPAGQHIINPTTCETATS
jgi:hypothetical protein